MFFLQSIQVYVVSRFDTPIMVTELALVLSLSSYEHSSGRSSTSTDALNHGKVSSIFSRYWWIWIRFSWYDLFSISSHSVRLVKPVLLSAIISCFCLPLGTVNGSLPFTAVICSVAHSYCPMVSSSLMMTNGLPRVPLRKMKLWHYLMTGCSSSTSTFGGLH